MVCWQTDRTESIVRWGPRVVAVVVSFVLLLAGASWIPVSAHHKPGHAGGPSSPRPSGPPSPRPTPHYPPPTPFLIGPLLSAVVVDDGKVAVELAGAEPLTTVRLFLGDRRTALGSFEVGDNGSFKGAFDIPDTAVAGTTKVLAVGEGLGAGRATLTDTIRLADHTDVGTQAFATVGSLALWGVLLLAGIQLLRSVTRRRATTRAHRTHPDRLREVPHLDTRAFTPRLARNEGSDPRVDFVDA